MPYSFSTPALRVAPVVPTPSQEACDCQKAQKFCAPSFVFSISGQVGFRHALLHLTTCSKRSCATLRNKTMAGMKEKLTWLFQEEAFLGCIHVQPYLYGSRKPLLNKQNWHLVARHLAHCPRESCAALRRSVLLSIRRHVNPQPVKPQLADTSDED